MEKIKMHIPKAELHVHLEGTLTPELALQLAKRNKVHFDESLISEDGESYLSDNFLHFLKVYDQVAAVIKKPEDYYDLTYDYLKNSALSGTIYTEMMYSPDHAELASGIPSIEHLNAIQQAVDDAEKKHQIVGRILITAVRHFGQESAEKVAKQGVKDKLPCVTGFGLGGDEAGYPPHLFEKAYAIANDGGLSCTIHAGEFAPSEGGMQDAIKKLPIKRIGHGVLAINDENCKAMLKDKNIPLEICPHSNVFLGLYKKIEDHPLPQFIEEGIRVSINSDDPPFLRTTIAQEYEVVQKVFNYSDDEMRAITKMAIEDAFVDEKTRLALLKRLEQ
jgi:adenosine deaminase